MELDATAEALAHETVAPVEASENDEYSAIYDKITQADPIKEEPEPQPEPKPEVIEAPGHIPLKVREQWANLTPEARDAISASHQEMAQKLSDQGRMVQGIAPIRDVLVRAVKEMPQLSAMKPEQVAAEVFELAQINAQFKAKPVETMLTLIQKHGMADAIRQHLGGQPQQAAAYEEIRQLKAQIERLSNPDYLREQVSAVTTQERVMDSVQQFAQSAEHWAQVEEHMPDFVPIARKKLGESASPKDVLAAAYDLAVTTYLPDVKAKAQAAEQAAVAPDPERTAAALKAKSVNVAGSMSGKPREMTEEERYAAAYDRAMRK